MKWLWISLMKSNLSLTWWNVEYVIKHPIRSAQDAASSSTVLLNINAKTGRIISMPVKILFHLKHLKSFKLTRDSAFRIFLLCLWGIIAQRIPPLKFLEFSTICTVHKAQWVVLLRTIWSPSLNLRPVISSSRISKSRLKFFKTIIFQVKPWL
jgi:hypothetical protein